MGVISFAAFRPHADKDADLLEVIAGRLPLLRRLGLATDREHIVVRTPSGIIIEVSEWVSKAAIDAAHRTPEVQALWARFDECSQYVTPNDAHEFDAMFPSSRAVLAEPGVRLLAWGHGTSAPAESVSETRGSRAAQPLAATPAPSPSADLGSDWAEFVKDVRQARDARRDDAMLRSRHARHAAMVGTSVDLRAAAIRLGQSLERDVYRVDLASFASKYIGETEKNLARLLDAGGNADAVLLFDEADALFGKRTEVRDSHDRYANIEVNYLLQRVEECEAVAIFGLTRRESIDPAFVRRLRMVVNV